MTAWSPPVPQRRRLRYRRWSPQPTTHASETITATLKIADFVDIDGDGLIDIHDLTMLHNMRYNLAGTSYKNTSRCDGRSPLAAPTPRAVTGYELMSDLDFDKDGDSTTWSGDSTNGYTLDGRQPGPYFDHRQWRLGSR